MLEGGAQTNTKIRMHVYIMFNMGVQPRDGHRNCKQKMLWNNVPIYYTHHCISILIYLVCLFESPFFDLYHYKCFLNYYLLLLLNKYIYIYTHICTHALTTWWFHVVFNFLLVLHRRPWRRSGGAMASASSSRSFPRIAEVRAYVASVPDEKQHVSWRVVTSLGQGVMCDQWFCWVDENHLSTMYMRKIDHIDLPLTSIIPIVSL